MAGMAGIRLSLAGAQDKLAVYISGDEISLPLGNAPSSHILKPVIEPYQDTVENEAFCMVLARELGIAVAPVEIRAEGGKKFLLVERYDRVNTGDSSTPLKRLHQEDFCQALGVVPEKKYQEEGGVSINDCFNLIRAVSSAPIIDLQQMLNAVILNFLIGNHDAHGKNFSLLYQATTNGVNVRLAPLYDLLCTMVYPDLSRNMAMSIGGKYKSESITPAHFDQMAEETGLAKPIVRQRVKEMSTSTLEILTQPDLIPPAIPQVTEALRQNAERIRSHF
jgi:serine/threonine-protein kinase HipA